ncbi:MAG TPA: helix-turn-helix domain-containing protein [Bacteroidota bacterium]|nr:helix-turn-helix domain-containing protein [Bacteroidota bacterium]
MESFADPTAERLLWVREYESCLNINTVCRKFGISRKTLYKWLKRYRRSGQDPESLIDQPRTPHRSPRQTSGDVSMLVLALRNETGYGPRKIRDILIEKHGISLSERTIWKIFQRTTVAPATDPEKLHELYANPVVPGHVIQLGVLPVSVPLPFSHIVQYTALDSVTRLRIVKFYKTHSTLNALDFVQHMREAFPFPIICIQTKIDTVFTSLSNPGSKSHAFTANIETMGMTHVVVTRGGLVRNRKIDRAHRVDMNDFYKSNTQWEPAELVKNMQAFIDHYNNVRKASELGNKTPTEVLRSYTEYKTLKQFKAA